MLKTLGVSSLSMDYLINHLDKSLRGKVMEDYEFYAGTIQSGGPLIVKLVVNRMQTNTILILENLKKLNVQDYASDDISELVSHVWAVKRLQGLELIDRNGTTEDEYMFHMTLEKISSESFKPHMTQSLLSYSSKWN